MKKKLLSLFLAVSMVAAMVIVPMTVSAANPWKTILNKDFSTAEQLANDGTQGGSPAGFIAHNNAFTYDAENGWLEKTNATRWDFSLGKLYTSPNVVRLSFDVMLDNTANYYFQPFANAWDGSGKSIHLTDFGGETIKRNEWQHYNIEFIPSNTVADQKVKIWRGDESYYASAQTITYSNVNNRTNISWVRFEQKTAPTTKALFDNFKIENKRLIFATDFSDPSGYAVDSNMTFEPSRKPGFQNLNGTVTSNQKFEVDASKGNLEIMRLWFAGTYDSSNPVKVSFDLKTDADNLINLLFRVGAQTDDVSDVFPINGDNIVGGEEFVPGVWQKYNFVLYPNSDVTKHYFKAWRGDSSDMATAKETSYAVGTRNNVSNISLINGVATDAGITYQIDNVIAEIFYNDGYDFTNPEITGVSVTIDNPASVSGNYWLIIAGYEGGAMDKVELKPLTLEKTDNMLTDTLAVPEDMAGCDNIKAFLWDSTTLEPLTDFIEVR